MSLTDATATAWQTALVLQGILPLAMGFGAGWLLQRTSGRRVRGFVGSVGIVLLPLAVMIGWSVGSLRPGLWDAIWFALVGVFGLLAGGHRSLQGRGLGGTLLTGSLLIATISAVELALPDDGGAGQAISRSDRWLAAGWPLPEGTLLVPRDRWRNGQVPVPWQRTCDLLFAEASGHPVDPALPADQQLAIALRRGVASARAHLRPRFPGRGARLGQRLPCCAGRAPLRWLDGEPTLGCKVASWQPVYGSKLRWLLHMSPAPLPVRLLLPRSRLARAVDRRIAALQAIFEPREPPPMSERNALKAIDAAFSRHASAGGRLQEAQ